MDKIYSRPRIRFRKRNTPKIPKIKIIIYFIVIIIFILIVFFLKAAYPIFIASCKNSAASTAINILNYEVSEVMIMYNYDDLVNVEKDTNGNVAFIEAKIIPINEIISKITNNIQSEIDSSPTISVKLNFGSVSGISALSVISPKIEVAMERAGGIRTEISSEFKSVGINQTLHRIYLDLTCNIGILTPFESIKETINDQVLLTETVIVGNVPETYYNFDNLGFSDVMEMID